MSYELLLRFDTDHPEFTRGFEAGRVWTLLWTDDNAQEFIVHHSNTEVMLRIAEATQRDVHSESLEDDTWTQVFYGPAPDDLPDDRRSATGA